MRKIKILVITLVLALLTFTGMATIAFHTRAGVATNVVTSGNIRLIVHETTDQGKPFPEDGMTILPGDVVTKKVNIENDCLHPFYLRVKLTYGVDSRELSADCFRVNINQRDWMLVDGWYYYKTPVQPDQITSNLFSRVEILGDKVDNRYIGQKLTLTVTAQAVQSEHNPITPGRPDTASGWPVN